MTTLAILLSTAKVNLVSARHEGEATELLALLKRTLAAESATVYEVCDAVLGIMGTLTRSYASIHPPTHPPTNQSPHTQVAFEFVGLLLRFLYPLDAQGKPTYREGEPPQDPDVAVAAHTLAEEVGSGEWRGGWGGYICTQGVWTA